MSSPPSPTGPTPAAIQLCDGLRFIPQRGSREWYCVVESPKQQRFFRIGRREYLIASALDGRRGLISIVNQLTESNPALCIDATTVEQTVRWLIASGLAQPVLSTDALGDSQPPRVAAAAAPAVCLPIDPFMFRIPILRGPLMEEAVKRLTFICSKISVIVTLLLMIAGVVCFATNTQHFVQLSAKLFVPSATLWWFNAWIVLKVVHELGHAVVCIAHGGKLRGAGIASFYFAPVPYVDTTDMWRLPDRRSRAFCAAGGMWFELVASAIAILICQSTENSTIQYFCISIATLGTFTTIAFNANPLVRFDGYYILSDVLNRPNLWTEGQSALKNLWSDPSRIYSSTVSVCGLPLLSYGIACFANRVILIVGLAWGAWLTYQGIGLGLIGLASYLWFVGPYLRKRELARKHAHLESITGQAATPVVTTRFAWQRWAFATGGLAAVVVLAVVLPSPWQPLSPGFVSCGDPITLRAQSDGIIAEIYQANDSIIQEGSPIVRLENPSLSLECERLRQTVQLAQERCLVLRAQAKMPELQSEQARLDAMEQQLNQVEQQLAQLVITAPVTGRLISQAIDNSLGKFIKVGQPFAEMAAVQGLEVHVSIAQADVDYYRKHLGDTTEIYLTGAPKLIGTLTEVRPRGSDSLNNPTLAAKYGGPVAVHMTSTDNDKQNPLKTKDPRFEARLTIDATLAESLTPGQLCRVGLVNRQMSIAGMLDRWKNAFIAWIKPAESKA